MPRPPVNPTERAIAPLPQGDPMTPGTRLFWVSFEETEDEQVTSPIKSPEQLYQESLMDAVESLRNEQAASRPQQEPGTPSQTQPSPQEATREDAVLEPRQTPPDEQKPPESDVADPPLSRRPSDNRRRDKRASSREHQSSPTPVTSSDQRRVRVRRTLLWPDDTSEEGQSNDSDQ